MTSAAAFAPAKVNLFLHVGGPGADGYHPLCSLMVFADVGDRLTAAPAASLDLQLQGTFAGELSAGPDNLVMRAAAALAGGLRPPGAAMILDKRLPVASGLGGGSSDAGAALRLLRRLWRSECSDDDLRAIAAGLGADGAACLWGRPVLAQGRGERLSAAPELPVLHAVLVNAGAPVATAEVYRRFDAARRFSDVTPPPVPAAFPTTASVADWLGRQRNDLEGSAIVAEPRVGAVLALLGAQPEVLLARMSGSGGTCFALCAEAAEAQRLAARLATLQPAWWSVATRLGGSWPDPD